MKRLAVVVFNLGGPDSPQAVQPFLFNLFSDPAIISLPQPLRWLVAKLISSRRAPVAQEIYHHLGGKSPLLEQTQRQADALATALGDAETEARVFIAMRYWHPMTDRTVAEVKAYAPDAVVLLPLYPQYSTTTSGSSLKLWHQEAARQGLAVPTQAVCCYPVEPGFVQAMVDTLDPLLRQAAGSGTPRLLFSAHGLPKKVVDGGDPYQAQVEQTAAAVIRALEQRDSRWHGLDWQVCYQSRVGPLEWIGPSTDAEIERAGRDAVPLVLMPLAFVSEHSETLVELDIEYGKLAADAGVPLYLRAATVQSQDAFIQGLAGLVRQALDWPRGTTPRPEGGLRRCADRWGKCPCQP